MNRHDSIDVQIPEIFKFLKPTPTSKMVHLGNKFDGGYVISSEAITNSNYLVSFGLGYDFSFERDFKNMRTQAKRVTQVDVYDHTVSRPNFLKLVVFKFISVLRPSSTRFKNYKIWLHDYREFFKENNHLKRKIVNIAKNKTEISAINTIPKDATDDVFLKIDIEGGEYDVLEALINIFPRITGMAIEFHNVSTNFKDFECLIKKLQEKHNLIYVHANNYSDLSSVGIPEVLEISFIRKDLDSNFVELSKINTKDFDFANSVRRPSYVLHF